MAAPSYTYSLVNGTTADAAQVMQNFNDVLNGITDGTKDLSISALTVAGTFLATGSSNTIGNSSSDDLTITASLASSLAIKTTASYDIGSSTLGLQSIYFGRNSQSVRIIGSSSMSATWTLTLPVSAGSADYVLSTNGSGVTSWVAIADANISASAAITGSKIVSATNSVSGVVTTSAQSFAGLKTFYDGIELDDDADQDTLNYYREDTQATTFTWDGTGGGTSGSTTIRITRVGRLVNLVIPQSTATTGSANPVNLNADTAIGTWARPPFTMSIPVGIIDNGNKSIGICDISAAGVVSFRKIASTNFTTTATCGSTGENSVTYFV